MLLLNVELIARVLDLGERLDALGGDRGGFTATMVRGGAAAVTLGIDRRNHLFDIWRLRLVETRKTKKQQVI